ncbi:MAG: MFS transporter [Verrucomicrobia bacterium]|nr:MFS transporter [Verrucomicrobiota bacterium]
MLATPYVFISLPGNLIMAGLLVGLLGLSKGQYGLIVALPAIFNGLQLLVTPLLSKAFSARNLTLAFSWANLLFWLVLTFALPYLPVGSAEETHKLAFALTVLFLFISATQSMTGVCWTAWVQEWVPASLRGQYFGRRNALLGFGTVLFVWSAGRLIDFGNNQLWTYQAILGISAALRFVSVRMQSVMPTENIPSKQRQLAKGSWWDQFKNMIGERCFMRYMLFGCSIGFWFSFIGPFMPPYMAEVLSMTVGQMANLMLLSSICSALMLPFWGKLIDRLGSKVIVGGCMIPWMLSNFLWLMVTPDNWHLFLPPMWALGGMMSGGVILGGFNLMLKLLPANAKTSGISMHLAFTSIAAALGPIIAGLILEFTESIGWSMQHTFRFFFVIYPAAVLASIWLLKAVDEPVHRAASSGMGAFRTLRQVFIMEGLVTLANIVPVRKRPKKT